MFEGLFRPGHLLIILIIVLFFFGPSKLPQLGGALGKTIRDFKKAVNDGAEDEKPQAAQKTIEAKAEGASSAPKADSSGDAGKPS